MNDYEVNEKIGPTKARTVSRIPGATPQLSKDIHAAVEMGVSYGHYMWLKYEKEEAEYFKKYGKHRRRI